MSNTTSTWQGAFRGGIAKAQKRNLGLVLAILIVAGGVQSQQSFFLTWDNIVVIMMQMSFVGIAALTTAALIISGNIDLSIGSLYAFTAVVAVLVAKVAAPGVAIAAGLAAGLAVGWLNGVLVWRIRISPIIITLGSLTLIHGVVLLMTGGYSVTGVPKDFMTFANLTPLGLPMPIAIWLILAVLAGIFLKQTAVGRYIFAIGGNKEAAEAAGLPIKRIVLACFALNGLFVGVVGVLAASRYGTADPRFGLGFELDVITAVILGGVAFSGGEGGMVGVVLAVIFIGIIDSGIVALGIDPFWTDVIKGAVLIAAVALDQLTHEQRDRYQRRLVMRENDAAGRP